jgi:hypothetical protein
MIFNTPPLSTKNFTAFANSSITFRVWRPLEKQLHREEVLVIRSLKLQKTSPLILNAFLYFPTANPTTPITCIEFFAKPGSFFNESNCVFWWVKRLLGKYSMLLHTKSDDQLFYFSSYVPIWFPIVYHYLCQIHVELI